MLDLKEAYTATMEAAQLAADAGIGKITRAGQYVMGGAGDTAALATMGRLISNENAWKILRFLLALTCKRGALNTRALLADSYFSGVDPLRGYEFNDEFWGKTRKGYMLAVLRDLDLAPLADGWQSKKTKDLALAMNDLFMTDDPAKKIGRPFTEKQLADLRGWRPEGFGVVECTLRETEAEDYDDDEQDEEYEDAAE